MLKATSRRREHFIAKTGARHCGILLACVLIASTVLIDRAAARSRNTGLFIGGGIISGIIAKGLIDDAAKSKKHHDADEDTPRRARQHTVKSHDDDDSDDSNHATQHRAKKAAKQNQDDDNDDAPAAAPKHNDKPSETAKSKSDDDGDDKSAAKVEKPAAPASAATNNDGAQKTDKPITTGALPVSANKALNVPATGNTTKISTSAEITAAQQHLKYLGYDIPAETGAVDLKTKIAIMQYQESLHAPTTGELTVEQLQGLFKKAAEKQANTK